MARFHDAMNAQIGREFGASHQYVAIAAYFDAETLPQLAAHFYRQSLEERNHAMMLVKYLLDADAPVEVPGIEAPQTAFKDVVEPLRLALDQEKQVTAQINELVLIAREEGDLGGEQFLQWFLEEQREEVSSASDLLKIVERAGSSNLLLVEELLSRSPVGNQGVDPAAPPAAGGAL